MQSIPENVEDALGSNKVFVFSKTYCSYCTKAKAHLDKLGVKYDAVECDVVSLSDNQKDQLQKLSGFTSFPKIFIGTKCIGGCDDLLKLDSEGTLKTCLDEAGIAHN